MRITPCSDPRIFTSADSFLFLQKKIESMHMKTIIALIGAMPLTISVELLKYIYQDWEFAKWIGVAVVVDTLLGIAKHWVHKDASSEDFWVKFSKKIVVYIGLLITANLLTNYTVDGNVVGSTQWMGTYLCTYRMPTPSIPSSLRVSSSGLRISTKRVNTLRSMRRISRIFVHCTASYQNSTTEATLRAEFKRNGWKNPGYHYVIKTDGNIIVMLDESKVANGVKDYNSHSIHVAWIGGIDRDHPKGIDNRTPEQKVALFDLLTKLKLKYPDAMIMGHRDISPDLNHNGVVDPWERIKECPCFDAMKEYMDINKITV